MSETKGKTFTYHTVRFQNALKGKTMQQLLNDTFDNTTVKDRHYSPADASEDHQFIATKSNFKGFFCANLWKYEDDQIAQVIKANFEAESIESKALPLETDTDGTPQHYLAGKLNFVCLNNSMIICQDMALKAVHLERYLHALIAGRNTDLPRTFQFVLEKTIPQDVQQNISGVKSVLMASDVETGSETDLVDEKKRIVRSSTIQNIKQACRYLFDADVNIKNLPLDENTKIKVSLGLDWKRENRKVHASRQLDLFANALRNVESEELAVSIETTSGVKYGPKDLRITTKKSVVHRDGMPSFDDISDKMIKWYTELNNAGQI